MESLILSLALLPALTAAITAAALAVMIRFAARLDFMVPPNHRSSHVRPTPGSGGIAIALGGILAGFILAPEFDRDGWVIFLLSMLVAVVGFRDDMQDLSVRARLLAQVFCVFCVTALILPHIPDEVFDQVLIPYPLLFIILLLAGIWWMNLFNFMDGIDGLAATQTIFMLLAILLFGAWRQPEVVGSTIWLWTFAIIAASAAFLCFNWPPARIFMGDVGSMYLAYMIFFLFLWAILVGWITLCMGFILSAVFVSDATVTLFTRMSHGARWYDAHRSHGYQRLARHWRSHGKVTLTYLALNLLWVAPLAFLAHLGLSSSSGWLVVLTYLPLMYAAIRLGAGKAGEIGDAPLPPRIKPGR